jgi:hypothetical protein
MEIERTLEDSSLPEPELGMSLEPGGNRNGVHYDRVVMQSFFYHDEDSVKRLRCASQTSTRTAS